jgi:hypothetical protein
MAIMIPKIEINSISFSKSKNDLNDFVKYDIEVSLDEMESTETGVKLKYGLTFLSNPKNVRINAEGIAIIYGDQTQTAKYLNPDANNIPVILNNIYQELFPLFYMLSKSIQVPCPAYKLSHISAPAKSEDSVNQTKSESLPELEGDDTIETPNVTTDVTNPEAQPPEMNTANPEVQQPQENIS